MKPLQKIVILFNPKIRHCQTEVAPQKLARLLSSDIHNVESHNHEQKWKQSENYHIASTKYTGKIVSTLFSGVYIHSGNAERPKREIRGHFAIKKFKNVAPISWFLI